MHRYGKNLLRKINSCGFGCVAAILLLTLPATALADAQETLLAGTQLLAQGRLDTALTKLTTAAENLPESVEAKLALGECLLKLGRAKEALAQYQAVLKLSPKHTGATQVVAALTGAGDFSSQLAGAKMLMQLGDYRSVLNSLRMVSVATQNADQRQQFRLLRAEAELWSAQSSSSHYAAAILANDGQQDIGRVMIALSTALSNSLNEDIQKQLKATKLPAPWDKRARFAIALGQPENASNPSELSATVAETISSIPPGPYRQKAERKIFATLIHAAATSNKQRSTDTTRAIIWPVVSNQPMPKPDAGNVTAKGTWITGFFDSAAVQLIEELEEAGSIEAQQGNVSQAILSFRMAFAVASRVDSLEVRDKQRTSVVQTASKSLLPPTTDKLNTQVEDYLRQISLTLAGSAVTAPARQAGYQTLLLQLQRHHEAKQVAAALDKLIKVEAGGNATLVAPLNQAVSDATHQKFLVQVADVAHVVAMKEANVGGVWQVDKKAALNEKDKLAIDLLRQAGIEQKEAMTAFQEILGSYERLGQLAAALTAINTFYRDAPEKLAWSLAAISLQRSAAEDARLLKGNQRLPAALPAEVKSAIGRINALLEKNNSQGNPQRAQTMLESLLRYYAAQSRRDLVTAVLAEVNNEGPLAAWVIWQQVEQLEAEAIVSLQRKSADTAGAAPEAVAKSHAAELKLISTILNEHSDSTYVHAAISRVQSIVQRYLKLHAFDVAKSVVSQFIAAHPKLLNIESLEFQVVEIAIAKADHDFSKRDAGVTVPTELPELYQQAMVELTKFLKKHSQGVEASKAETKMLAIMQKLGSAGAWNAAREALAMFVAAAENYHPPQKLEMYRAATYLGELDKGHGVSLLTQKTTASGAEQGQTLIARRDAPAPGSGFGGGGGAFGGPGEREEAPPVSAAPVIINGGIAANGPGGQSGGDDPFGAPQPVDSPQQNIPYPSVLPPSEPNQTALALIRQSQQQRFTQLAMLDQRRGRNQQAEGDNAFEQPGPSVDGALLSAAELKRQDEAADNAYKILLNLAKAEADAIRSLQQHARQQILWMFGFFEGQQRPGRAHDLLVQYLADQPEDPARLALHYQAIQNQLNAAGQQHPGERIDLAWLDKRDAEFQKARAAIADFANQYKDQKEWAHKARMLAVSSYETEANLAVSISPERAGGFLVNAAQTLFDLYQSKPTHPGVSNFPQRLYNLAERLYSTGQRERAIFVHSRISVFFPVSPQATQSVLRMAQLHATGLANPLRAVETYQEYMSLTGQDDAVKSQIYSIAQQLSSGGRYLEALHVFGVFVDSFPVDARACQALQAIGQVHQANEAWNEALATYERVLDEYPSCAVIADVKLTMAECHINLSQWSKARRIYEEFPQLYPKHAQAKTATARLPVLKQLDRYQGLLADEAISRNKDDAQFQIARIVLSQLSNRIKAIEEFGKVVKEHPKSDLADDAQLEIGKALLALDRRDEARDALRLVAKNYETSPSADDALYLIGKSYEQQAQSLATVTQEIAWKSAFERNQRGAYAQFNDALARQTREQSARRAQLKSEGKSKELGLNEAADAFRYNGVNYDNISNSSRNAVVLAQTESALQVANKQDRINDAYREAVAAYLQVAANYPLGDKTDDSLLEIAQIYETKLKDRTSAMATYQRVVKLFPGTPVAEDAAWKVAEFYAEEDKYTAAATAYREFIRNYPASSRVADAQFALAETLEQLGRWVDAMDAYEVFRQKFSSHAKARLAADQINWIKAYRK